MTFRGAKALLICAPSALGTCQSQPTSNSSLEAQVAAASQKAEQALATARQALDEA